MGHEEGESLIEMGKDCVTPCRYYRQGGASALSVQDGQASRLMRSSDIWKGTSQGLTVLLRTDKLMALAAVIARRIDQS